MLIAAAAPKVAQRWPVSARMPESRIVGGMPNWKIAVVSPATRPMCLAATVSCRVDQTAMIEMVEVAPSRKLRRMSRGSALVAIMPR